MKGDITMTRMYWVMYHGFANYYELAWTDKDNADDCAAARKAGFEPITRKNATTLARQERERAVYDAAFSGYADDHIWPFRYCRNMDFIDVHCRDKAYIVEA
jgi:hypothetical protein